MQSLAVNPQKTAVRVLLDETFPSNPDKIIKREILSSFMAPDATGKTDQVKIFKFKDEQGQEFSPALTNKLESTYRMTSKHPYFDNNVAAFQAYKALYEPNITIFDPTEASRDEVKNISAQLSAAKVIQDLAAAGSYETMVDMLRRLEGNVSDMTTVDLTATLLRIAQSQPARILTMTTDANYETKVKIDRAVAAGRIVFESARFYQYKHNNIMIADGIDDMVRKYMTDPGLRAFIDDQPLGQAQFSIATADTPLIDPNKDWRDSGEIVDTTTLNGQATEKGQEPKLSDERLDQIVQAGIDMEVFGKREGPYELPGKVEVATKGEVLSFYKQNIDQAVALEIELKGYGAPNL